MPVADNIRRIKETLPAQVTLVAVSKTQPVEKVLEAYASGQRVFGENRVQELIEKQPLLPADIEWHLIGHLQTNKVKYIAPFISLIHSIDSLKLLEEVNKQALKNNRVIDCLLQVYIAKEESKFGLDFKEAEELLASEKLKELKNIRITGLMGMATNTDDHRQVRQEFMNLKRFFDQIQNSKFKIQNLSMGMSSDYTIAVEEGSTMVRIGSNLFNG